MPTAYLRRVRLPDSLRRTRVRKQHWIDPFPGVQGSSIEKMVMAELIRRGIFFEHTPQTQHLGGLVDPTWEPDLLFPQYKIWMEIQGSYFHTLPGAVERDSLRFAIIAAAGWRPMFWWENDIRTRLPWLMDQVPEFYFVNKALNAKFALQNSPGVPFLEGGVVGGKVIDHLKGLRTMLRARARPPQKIHIKYRTKRKRK